MAVTPRIDVSTSLRTSAAEPTSEELAELAAGISTDVLFTTPLSATGGRVPDTTWPLHGARATGEAAVYYANGRTHLQKPFLFADGFNYGKSDLPALFNHFNAPYESGRPGFFDQLLARGHDVVLIGFDERHTHIQHNAEVAIEAIDRARAERRGSEPLTVGGGSMGGIVTRYALAKLEDEGVDHETATYLSWDSPHNGAWIPLILQQMAYFFEKLAPAKPGQPSQADLIRSPAAQQLLWAWVPDAKYSGGVATASELRRDFVRELAELGNFPRRPRLLGVANGRGDGVGRPLPAGEIAFDWQALIASATARFQPDRGTEERIGGMHAGLELRRSTTTEVPALDGVPGGALASFGMVADAIKAKISEEHRSGAFVPTVSAAAVDFDPIAWDIDPNLNLLDQSPERFLLDDVAFATENTEHSHVSGTLAEWILDRLS
ncbi:esterase/lipase family protein [Kitasatospora sp. NPDC053057]|uniref:esterase/lipase family protein n=1 Tax=Kitasatospora sp. NPDC053057 TaxID=3364062 RepID=UPI0037C942FF